MKTATKIPTQIEPLNEDFISFLRIYEENEYSEFLHQALYYLMAEGIPDEQKQEISHVLYLVRDQLNDLSKKYL